MTLKDLAETLVQSCRTGGEAALLDTCYAKDAVSVEAADAPNGTSAVTEGLDGIRAKHAWWEENFEVHDGSVDGPFLHGEDRFAVIFEMDVSTRATGERSRMKEVAVYTVRAGKIVREEFFYTM